jgi:hypothetical protein
MSALPTIIRSDFGNDLSEIIVVLYLSGCFVVMLSFALNWGEFLTQLLSVS